MAQELCFELGTLGSNSLNKKGYHCW